MVFTWEPSLFVIKLEQKWYAGPIKMYVTVVSQIGVYRYHMK
jgi:hypothetical protein